jgi:hypothetical protein
MKFKARKNPSKKGRLNIKKKRSQKTLRRGYMK